MSNIFNALRSAYRAAVVCGFVLGLCTATAQGQVFSQPTNVSNLASNSAYPAMIVDSAGNIYVAWVDSASGINIARSTNAGLSFLPAVRIGTVSIGAAFQPQIAVDPTGTIIEIAWAKPSAASGAPAGTFDVFVSQLTIGAVITTQVSTAVKLVDSPRLAFDGTGVDVVWGNTETWISHSPNGTTFNAPINLSIAPQDSGGPRVAVDKSGNIFVAWTDRLAEDQNKQGNFCTNPTGTTNGNGIITVFSNTFGGNYYLNETPTSSTPKSANTRNLSKEWVDRNYPAGYFGCSYDSLHLFFDQKDNLHLLWADEAPLEELLTSTAVPPANGNGSPTFTFPIGFVGDEGVGSPSVATDTNGSIYVVYASGPKAPALAEGIYFTRSDDDGATFFPESMVVSAPGAISPAFPQIAVDSNRNVNIVWEQADQAITATSSNTFHLFFGHSADRGTTFPTIRPLSTMSPSVLCVPPIPSGTTPPTTPDMTTCGTVQMGVDNNSNADLVWVNNPGSAANIDFATANVGKDPPDDFIIGVNSPPPSAYSGQTVTFNVTTQAIRNFSSAITLGCNDSPEVMTAQGVEIRRSDFSCTFSPASGSINPGSSATVSLAIPPGFPAEPFSFAINGTSGGTTHRVKVMVTDLGLAGSVQPASATLAVGASASFNVTIINPNAFAGTVSFLCNGQPAWIQCAFNPSSMAPSANSSSVMTVTVVSAPTGAMLSYPPSTRRLPAQRTRVLWSVTFAALCLIAMAMISIGRHEKRSAAFLLRGFAVMALTLVLAVGLVSCGGAAGPSANPTGGSGANGSGGGGGARSNPVTGTFTVQAQSANGITNLGTVSITTP